MAGNRAASLGVLSEHTEHPLLADEEAGAWSAASCLEHLTTTAPDTARG